jgi:hypothetical protein
MASDISSGTTVNFDGNFFATITSMTWSGMSRPAVPTTTFATGAGNGDTFVVADTYDPGTLDVEILFQDTVAGAPALTGAAAAVTVTFGGTRAYTCNAFMTDCSIACPGTNEMMTMSATLKFTGDITWPA